MNIMKNNKVQLIGKYTVLNEVEPKYFTNIIEWRNNPENNRFLNQPYKLTSELQQKWYNEYLQDDTQGLFIMIDKEKNKPFGTIGWTDYDNVQNVCVSGRVLIGESEYRGSIQGTEAMILFGDYLYENLGVDKVYGHAAASNKKVVAWNKKLGFHKSKDTIKFPEHIYVNGIEHDEYLRTKDDYLDARGKIIKLIDVLGGNKND